MTRSNRSARQAGARFERQVADYLAAALDDDRIDRRVKTGAKDRGDIGGVRTFRRQRVVIECKDVTTLALGQWVREAEVERGNDDAVAGVVVHKRRGTAHIGAQYVAMTVDDLVALLHGERPPAAESGAIAGPS